ncbi:hypothetical protein FBUS_10883 [Fasciolopsis buskii]|uniref:Geminin n=1 Tax=Fasciolopsis buskii TaxID=27845 RepID=A0A8E0VFS1_9TREM|nr:hypothetical protein FBUS_10883 [Fasciolopsis buski]
MAALRKGLKLRNNILDHETREISKPLKNQAAPPKRVTKLEKCPFEIYVDPVEISCQHCGSVRNGSATKPTSKPKLCIQTAEIAIQTESHSQDAGDLKALLCSENPPESYWEQIAEQRRVALKETLDENRELCDLVEKLNSEIERLGQLNKHTERFAHMYLKLCKDSENPLQSTDKTNSNV